MNIRQQLNEIFGFGGPDELDKTQKGKLIIYGVHGDDPIMGVWANVFLAIPFEDKFLVIANTMDSKKLVTEKGPLWVQYFISSGKKHMFQTTEDVGKNIKDAKGYDEFHFSQIVNCEVTWKLKKLNTEYRDKMIPVEANVKILGATKYLNKNQFKITVFDPAEADHYNITPGTFLSSYKGLFKKELLDDSGGWTKIAKIKRLKDKKSKSSGRIFKMSKNQKL
jgi:hypothetical protein